MLIDRFKLWMCSKPWYWRLRSWSNWMSFVGERSSYQRMNSFSKTKIHLRIFSSFSWLGLKSLFWVILFLMALNFIEAYTISKLPWLSQITPENIEDNIEQLRLYAQLLTAIFSIYFATIGIILSSGYTRFRGDIIQMLTNEQVGSIYSRVLVFAAIFCLVATATPQFGVEPGLLVYSVGTLLTMLSALSLFPLGQRLFNFFDPTQLVRNEIIPKVARHIQGAANPTNSTSLSHHHSSAARKGIEQLSYIDNRIKADKDRLTENLPTMSHQYSVLLLHYIQQKQRINQDSFWFPRRVSYKKWFFAGDSMTTMALKTSSQHLLVEQKPDHQWLENDVVDRLANHIELAFEIGDLRLALDLIGQFSGRASVYANQFHFEIGMQELNRIRLQIEKVFSSISTPLSENSLLQRTRIADTWAALGSNFCLDAIARMFTFEKELNTFFQRDEWTEQSLLRLPAFLQRDLAFIIEGIKFEEQIEGRRLSRPKYLQQVTVQKLLKHYSKTLCEIVDFYQRILPEFVSLLVNSKMSQAATQVTLASLHCYWKVPRRLEELELLLERYQKYEHYSEKEYVLNKIDIAELMHKVSTSRDKAVSTLANPEMVAHIFDSKDDPEIPDHFGYIYFQLAEECIESLQEKDVEQLNKVLPMFLTLGFLAADSKFVDPKLDVNDEFRIHLVSTVINDMASILGFALLYGAYFQNEKLPQTAIKKFEVLLDLAVDTKKQLRRMLLLSNTHGFSMAMSPRTLIRTNWQLSFEQRARDDGYLRDMGWGPRKRHPEKLVRVFLHSHTEASHLFFAKYVLPQLESIDFQVDHRITSLQRSLNEGDSEVQNETE